MGGLIGGPLFAALGAQGLFVALAITCCVWFALRYRTPEPPRHRSRLLPLEWQGRDAAFWQARLAQIPGIVEVEVSERTVGLLKGQ